MGRKKIENYKQIEDKIRLKVTFYKRRSTLFKKGLELNQPIFIGMVTPTNQCQYFSSLNENKKEEKDLKDAAIKLLTETIHEDQIFRFSSEHVKNSKNTKSSYRSSHSTPFAHQCLLLHLCLLLR